ncbi:hypothetical protein VIA_004155 [Vibrio orientalis CIP 102891 = ATCC 33934]|uniref:Uncharacterized protein n=1 Tax=Vibrio orientalis CIP 102891 = ATCC 33934 TaxID=675816 RepID=A0ABP2GZE3_VIBOR|nr:hypothetical protein VIA_004155 [Vibrio orientalis CIP 102891 = ATCC 33934]
MAIEQNTRHNNPNKRQNDDQNSTKLHSRLIIEIFVSFLGYFVLLFHFMLII